jgi:hypothetical protein
MGKVSRDPIFSIGWPVIKWVEKAKNIWVDEEVEKLNSYAVYRYATFAELIALTEGRITFQSPACWPDKYEGLVSKSLFGPKSKFSRVPIVAKCYSLQYQSEALWQIYRSSGGLARIGIKLHSLIDGLGVAKWPMEGRVFIGRSRYMENSDIRNEIEAISAPRATEPHSVMEGLLMKRSGFSHENEVRVAFFSDKKTLFKSQILSCKGFPKRSVTRVLLDPYLPTWQTDELVKLLKKYAGDDLDVLRSNFDKDPA